MKHSMLTVCFVVVAVVVVRASPAASSQWVPQPVMYVQPVYSPVIDGFRPPAHIGASGNRGLEYGDTAGAVVEVAAPGYVSFAGQVAGRLAITVEHADGVNTTYTGVDELWVSEGDVVEAFTAIARAGDTLHFGARIGLHYLDPQILIDASTPVERPRLVAPPGTAPS